MYKSAQVQGSSTYNYSQNPDVQQLTQLFLGLATTLDYGRKLAWNYRFDKLGMNQTLRELEDLQASHQVEELAAIEPILRKIADDSSLMHISRQSAQHLLKTISVAGRGQAKRRPAVIFGMRRLRKSLQIPRAIFGNFMAKWCSNR